jgi:hypothetical protein
MDRDVFTIDPSPQRSGGGGGDPGEDCEHVGICALRPVVTAGGVG